MDKTKFGINIIEQFVMAKDKEAFLKLLVPGTKEFYYLSAIYSLNKKGANLSESEKEILKTLNEKYGKQRDTSSNNKKKTHKFDLRYQLHRLSKSDISAEEQAEVIEYLQTNYLKFNYNFPKPSDIQGSEILKDQEKLSSKISPNEYSEATYIEEAYTNLSKMKNLSKQLLTRLDIQILAQSSQEILLYYINTVDLQGLGLDNPGILIKTLIKLKPLSENQLATIYSRMTKKQLKTYMMKYNNAAIDEKEFISEIFMKKF